jgi:hypothetical protein
MLRRRLTPTLVSRAAQSDISWWKMMHCYCPTCCIKISNLTEDESIYPHMVGECEKELILVGPNWVRPGRHVDAPLADRAELDCRPNVSGRFLLCGGLALLAVAIAFTWVVLW